MSVSNGFCKYVFLYGARAGEECGNSAMPGTNFCVGCSKKKTTMMSPVFVPAASRSPTFLFSPYLHRQNVIRGISASILNILFTCDSERPKAIGVDEKNDGSIRALTEEERQYLKSQSFEC